ncbi:MAG: Radical SAM domain protein [Olavius algarvensis Delta 4 endosymbiont]|nr:MAG: Radical SAM domain protein [Olavius algarvensis Delta 4 endosymbiont]
MRILLVNPPAENEITTQVSKFVKGESSMQPPLGLLYIAAYMRSKGYEDVFILDCQGQGIDYGNLPKKIIAFDPDIVGMTAMTFTMMDVSIVADIVKKLFPSVPVVIGGPHVDIYPNETMALKNVDYVIRGEGEIPFFDLVRALETPGDEYKKISNLVWIDREGKINKNPVRDVLNNYDEIPFPARDMLPVDNYFSIMTSSNPVTSLMTAKGCPYNCIFCYHLHHRVSYRSVSSVVDEMEECKELRIREVFFTDDTFYLNSKRAIEICDEIVKRKLKLPWGARARVNNVSEEMLTAFKKAGCKRLHIGVESGSQKILDRLNKKITVGQIEKAFSLCRKHKIKTLAYCIIGSPDETLKEVDETINLIGRIKPDYVQYSRMTPMPDTILYREGLKRKILSHDYWLEFAKDPTKPVSPQFWTENFSKEELVDLADYATQRFYLRPSYVLKSLFEVKNPKEFLRKANVGLNMVKGNISKKAFRLKMP